MDEILKTYTFESSDEDMVAPFQAKKWKILSDSEDDIGDGENRSDEKELFSSVNGEKPSLKKFKIRQRCVDSSDEENGDLNVRLMKTSKVEREKKLLEMRKKVRAKRRLYSSGDDSDDSQDLGSRNDDVDIDGNLVDFVVSDNVVEMEEEESEDGESEDDESEEGSEGEGVQQRGRKPGGSYVYTNPYKEMDELFEDNDIMKVLSKKMVRGI